MADADADFQLSSDASDFEGFDEADYNNQVARPMPNESDISLSDIPSSSEEDSEDGDRVIAPNADINNRTWRSLDLNNPGMRPKHPFTGANPGCTLNFAGNYTEKDFFFQFFTPECLEIVAEETNRYARQQQALKGPDPYWVPTTAAEITQYIGIRIFMSVVHLPTNDMYWSQDWLFGKFFIPNILKRDRFDKLQQYLHVSNNEENPAHGQPGHDKLYHVRPGV